MTTPEFSRPVDIREADGKRLSLAADADERAALAKRFDLVRIDRLEAEVTLDRAGDGFAAKGTLSADIVQSCAVSAEDLPVAIREDLSFRFVPARHGQPDEEIELDAGDLDEIEYTGSGFDVGEAVAQSLALSIDPFAIGPDAERARREAGLLDESDTGPFAALKGLKPLKP
jgi:uncharacterized metal-binding protein YceD (DUF177 family)